MQLQCLEKDNRAFPILDIFLKINTRRIAYSGRIVLNVLDCKEHVQFYIYIQDLVTRAISEPTEI